MILKDSHLLPDTVLSSPALQQDKRTTIPPSDKPYLDLDLSLQRQARFHCNADTPSGPGKFITINMHSLARVDRLIPAKMESSRDDTTEDLVSSNMPYSSLPAESKVLGLHSLSSSPGGSQAFLIHPGSQVMRGLTFLPL